MLADVAWKDLMFEAVIGLCRRERVVEGRNLFIAEVGGGVEWRGRF